jgi:phosphatidylinositol-4,5-bisphosphate 3-kinase catalytic subunit alpha/beta/delta
VRSYDILFQKYHFFFVKQVNDFRYKMNILADEISHKRGSMTWLEKIAYQFPPKLAKTDEMPETVRGRLRNDHFVIVTKFHNINNDVSFTFNVPYYTTPNKLLDMILTKMQLTKMTMSEKNKRTADYILKVCGQDEYLFGDHKLIQFLYIQVSGCELLKNKKLFRLN